MAVAIQLVKTLVQKRLVCEQPPWKTVAVEVLGLMRGWILCEKLEACAFDRVSANVRCVLPEVVVDHIPKLGREIKKGRHDDCSWSMFERQRRELRLSLMVVEGNGRVELRIDSCFEVRYASKEMIRKEFYTEEGYEKRSKARGDWEGATRQRGITIVKDR